MIVSPTSHPFHSFTLHMTKEQIVKTYSTPILFFSAISITLLLFYIDELYFDFRWMHNPANWIAFAVYSTFILIGELFLFRVMLEKLEGLSKLVISIIGGSVLGVLIVICLIFTAF